MILVNACLSSIPLYMLYFLEVSNSVIKKMYSQRKMIVWHELDGRKIAFGKMAHCVLANGLRCWI
jgi:hypothetical protein